MRGSQTDETAQEILVTYQSGNAYLAQRIKQSLAPTKFPVLTRRERWNYSPDQYLIVIRLCDEQGKKDNILQFDINKIRSAVLDQPEVKHRNLTDREQEKYVGKAVSQQVMEALRGLI